MNVLDSTGLTEAYDFTLNFSGVNLLRARPQGQPAAAAPGGDDLAADPSGVLYRRT